MAKIGSKQKFKDAERYAAYHEHALSIEAFADAMRTVDVGYVADHIGYHITQVPMSMNMKNAMERFIVACSRIRSLDAKEA